MSSESGGWGGVESDRAGLWGLVLMFGLCYPATEGAKRLARLALHTPVCFPDACPPMRVCTHRRILHGPPQDYPLTSVMKAAAASRASLRDRYHVAPA
jgi:hypothetical protein